MKNLKWINAIAFAVMVTVNALANLLPIGGNTTSQISEAYPNLFTPAPITFAIWGLIYLMMALFVIYQFEVFDHGEYSAKARENIGLWFAVSCALNIVWIFLWHYRLIGLSVFAILMLLASLIILQHRLQDVGESFFQRFAAKAGFSVYIGWIIAASLANLVVLAASFGWNTFGLKAEFWTALTVMIGSILAAWYILAAQDRIAGLAVMWAYAGILIRHISPAYFGAAHPYMIITAFLGEAVILTAVLLPQSCRTAYRKFRAAEKEA